MFTNRINGVLQSFSRTFTSGVTLQEKYWRLPQIGARTAWPNYKEQYVHRRHRNNIYVHTYGVQKESEMRCVDNSALGRQAMSLGRPPRVIQVYSHKHKKRSHGSFGKLGDRVLLAVMGQKKKGIIVGLRAKQLPGVPRYDTNNVVLIEENGNPSGNRINAPLPNIIRPGLTRDSNPKKADYTKLFAIAKHWI